MKNFAARELATIDAIDGVLAHEKNPEHVALLHEMKAGHQEAHGQLAALARAEHRPTGRAWPLATKVMQLAGGLARTLGETVPLDALRDHEHQLEQMYIEARDGSEGLARDVFDRLAKRASQRYHVLGARGERTCMRCMLDRAGPLPALVREQPRIYVCAACNAEVHASLPPDLAALANVWPDHVRESRIIERALGRSSKQRARDEVHAVLAGQTPEVPPEARPERVEELRTRIEPAAASPTLLSLPPATDDHEAEYTAWLFDYRSVRARW